MRIISKEKFESVLRVFDQEHSAKNEGSNGWAREHLNFANKYFKGEWYLVELSKEDITNVLLMNHHHKGGIELISQNGEKLGSVLVKWEIIKNEYEIKNPECYNNIIRLGKTKLNPIFLCTEPVKTSDFEEHQKMKHEKGALVHLDGMHRLVGWGLNNRLEKIKSFIAGPL